MQTTSEPQVRRKRAGDGERAAKILEAADALFGEVGYDGVSVRAMERLEIMFGGRGDEPSSWHFYTNAPVDVANNDRVAASCRQRTLASPGRPNSPDYSGAFAAGSFE